MPGSTDGAGTFGAVGEFEDGAGATAVAVVTGVVAGVETPEPDAVDAVVAAGAVTVAVDGLAAAGAVGFLPTAAMIGLAGAAALATGAGEGTG